MLYENARTYQTGWSISFFQNPNLNHRTNKILNLDILSRYSNYNRTSRDMTFFRPVCRAKITYRGFSSWVAVLTAHEWSYSVTQNTRTNPTCSDNDRFPIAALLIYWPRLTQHEASALCTLNNSISDSVTRFPTKQLWSLSAYRRAIFCNPCKNPIACWATRKN